MLVSVVKDLNERRRPKAVLPDINSKYGLYVVNLNPAPLFENIRLALPGVWNLAQDHFIVDKYIQIHHLIIICKRPMNWC